MRSIDRARSHLQLLAQDAVEAISSVLKDPIQIGAKEKLAAARDILDRVGLAKSDAQQIGINVHGSVMLLPPKNSVSG